MSEDNKKPSESSKNNEHKSGDRNRRPYDKNRKYGNKDRKYGDKDRKFSGQRRRSDHDQNDRSERRGKDDRRGKDAWKRRDDRDRKFGDRDRKFGDRDSNRGERSRDGHRSKNLGRGGTRGGGRSDRGGAQREFTEEERLQHSLRPVREKHTDPEIPANVEARDLHPGARNQLKTLDKELADVVAKHLVMVGNLVDDDPELANQHAISAMRKAGRIPVTRETYAITSYVLGDYATALRELRTYRRLSGSELQLALMLDCERALGRPEKAIETAREVNITKLPVDQQVQVAIALSGARLDMGQPLQALYELEIEQLKPDQAFSWSPELFACYANVLEDLGRFDESKTWRDRAILAEKALNERAESENEGFETLDVIELETIETDDDKPGVDGGADTDGAVNAETDVTETNVDEINVTEDAKKESE